MKTIGTLLRNVREEKGLSLVDLEKETKIKQQFLAEIEEEKWNQLPEYPVVQGFVKNIASSLALDREHVLAVLRRDYPPKTFKNLKINPNPDISQKFSWSPRLTFVAGVVVVILVISSYLFYQYLDFINPPFLSVDNPKEGETVRDIKLKVDGKTDPEATVIVNSQPALVEENGKFSIQIEIFAGTQTVSVSAKSRSGKETVIERKIVPELE